MHTRSDKKLEHLIEQKILEFFGDPDASRTVRKDFLTKLKRRTSGVQRLTSHAAIVRKYGVR